MGIGFCTIRINATINSWKGLTPKISLLRLQSADSSKEHKTESPLKKNNFCFVCKTIKSK